MKRKYGKSMVEMPIFSAIDMQLVTNENRSLRLKILTLEKIIVSHHEVTDIKNWGKECKICKKWKWALESVKGETK